MYLCIADYQSIIGTKHDNLLIMKSDNSSRAGLVWIISGTFLLIYSGIGLLNIAIPGVEDLVLFMNGASGWYLYLAAFLSIFLEGLYVVGNFLPGSTMVLLLAVISQAGGTVSFIYTILAIFVGWTLAGIINITLAHRLTKHSPLDATALAVKDHLFTTWYPAFRANYEVSQVVSGIPAWKVFFSSVRVKILASIAAALYALVLPLFIDINSVSNEEGFITVFGVALICISVGGWQMRTSFSTPRPPTHS